MLSKKLTTAITTFSTIAALVVTPAMAFADTSVGVLGNGAESQNQVTVNKTNTNTAVQTNTADVTNDVHSSADSGHNHSDFNTGGSSIIETGAATNNTQIVNELNRNVLQQNPCNCANDGTQVLLDGNGAFSANDAHVNSTNDTSMFQTNDARVNNSVDSHATTGNNTSDFGTNGGSTIITGGAKNNVGILNALNENIATSGNGLGGSLGGNGTDVREIGNGAFSTNNVDVTKRNTNIVDQNNSAFVWNDVNSSAHTGNNSGDFTTGGSTLITTGPAWNGTSVATFANRNFLAGDNCGCGDFTFLKEAVNGAFSDNNITADLSNDNSKFQTNDATVHNNFDSHAQSGFNSVDFSTASRFGFSDPAILTGGASSNTSVETHTNDNQAGNGLTLGGWNLNFTISNPFGTWMAH